MSLIYLGTEEKIACRAGTQIIEMRPYEPAQWEPGMERIIIKNFRKLGKAVEEYIPRKHNDAIADHIRNHEVDAARLDLSLKVNRAALVEQIAIPSKTKIQQATVAELVEMALKANLVPPGTTEEDYMGNSRKLRGLLLLKHHGIQPGTQAAPELKPE